MMISNSELIMVIGISQQKDVNDKNQQKNGGKNHARNTF